MNDEIDIEDLHFTGFTASDFNSVDEIKTYFTRENFMNIFDCCTYSLEALEKMTNLAIDVYNKSIEEIDSVFDLEYISSWSEYKQEMEELALKLEKWFDERRIRKNKLEHKKYNKITKYGKSCNDCRFVKKLSPHCCKYCKKNNIYTNWKPNKEEKR